jgi:DNA-binding PucR family transcriptional regulator
VIAASFQEYVPLSDLAHIVVVCIGVAIIAPSAAALVITGFEAQAGAQASSQARLRGDIRIALGFAIMAALVVAGIYALVNR